MVGIHQPKANVIVSSAYLRIQKANTAANVIHRDAEMLIVRNEPGEVAETFGPRQLEACQSLRQGISVLLLAIFELLVRKDHRQGVLNTAELV